MNDCRVFSISDRRYLIVDAFAHGQLRARLLGRAHARRRRPKCRHKIAWRRAATGHTEQQALSILGVAVKAVLDRVGCRRLRARAIAQVAARVLDARVHEAHGIRAGRPRGLRCVAEIKARVRLLVVVAIHAGRGSAGAARARCDRVGANIERPACGFVREQRKEDEFAGIK